MSLISEGSRNTRRLCSIAGVSPKCYYAHAKGASGKEMSVFVNIKMEKMIVWISIV